MSGSSTDCNYQSRSHSEAEKSLQVPFLFHELIEVDSNGLEYTIQDHDITVRFPTGAIAVAEREKLQFGIGVAMYGPFKFVDNMRPISPILWLCPLDENVIKLNKPFQVILPHFLSGDKVQNHGVEFAKANHRDCADGCYTFDTLCDCAEPIFATASSKSYGILEVDHCCFYCLQANISPEITKDAEYTLVRLESVERQEVHFCAIYQLNTCYKVSP